MKPKYWTDEWLAARTVADLRQLIENCSKKGVMDLLQECELELLRRPQSQKNKLAQSIRASGDYVEAYHFVCEDGLGTREDVEGVFWSGSWVVAEINVVESLRYGAYVALHSSKAQLSYRQGEIIGYQRIARSMVDKPQQGIDFKIKETFEPLKWVGSGSGEKGYSWGPIKDRSEKRQ